MNSMSKYLILIWLNSLISSSGSLFFSEIMKLPPCTLCWYQRMMMFPIVVILGIGIYHNDNSVKKYVGAFLALGLMISTYHTLIYYDLIPQVITTCSTGSSCTEKQINWFGFISIPLLSFLSFGSSTLFFILDNLSEKKMKGKL